MIVARQRPKLGSVFSGEGDRTVGLAGLLATGDAETAQPTPVKPPVDETPEPGDMSPIIDEQTSRDMPSPQVKEPESVPRDVVDEPAVSTPPAAATSAGSSDKAGAVRRGGRPAPGRKTGSQTLPLAVVLDAPTQEDLRAYSKRTGQTLGTVVLNAIEAGADVLPTRWRETTTRPSGRLFAGPPAVWRRDKPGVQVQFRVGEADAAVLDRLVGEWGAPSRSVLVNEALRLYIGARPESGDSAAN